MTVHIESATRETLLHVLRHLRAIDHEELSATVIVDDDGLVDRILTWRVMAFVAVGQEPIAAWGLLPMWPGVGAAFAFGTDAWGQAIGPMTRHVRSFMIPALRKQGYHRIEARGLAHREDTARWVAMFGAEPEAVLRSFGQRGEDFVLYRWLAHEHHEAKSARQEISGDRVSAGNG